MELCKYCQYIDAKRGQYTRVHMIVKLRLLTTSWSAIMVIHKSNAFMQGTERPETLGLMYIRKSVALTLLAP